MKKLYCLFVEISDQYGTSRLVGIYDNEQLAINFKPKTERSYIQIISLNEKPNHNQTYYL